MKIHIAKEYTKTPGGRYIAHGEYSGEDFRTKLLEPKYLEAKKLGKKLEIDFDGGYGYATAFIEEAFGGLARNQTGDNILDILEFKSNDQLGLIDDVINYIKDATTPNCMDCEHHEVLPDPDPDDFFCDDDKKVRCKLVKDHPPKMHKNSVCVGKPYITVACRPYMLRKECQMPKWCPNIKK